MWLPSTIQMASEYHITVFYTMQLQFCTPMQISNSDIYPYEQSVDILKFHFKLFFCCWQLGQVIMHPCTLKLLHIHAQHLYLSTKGTYQLLQFWRKKGGKRWSQTRKKQRRGRGRGQCFICDIAELKDSSHFLYLNEFLNKAPEYSSLSDSRFPVSCHNENWCEAQKLCDTT